LLELDEELEEEDEEESLPRQVGLAGSPEPWKPMTTDCPSERLAFQLMLLAVIVLPVVVKEALQPLLNEGAESKTISTLQPLTLPTAVISISA